MSALARSLRRLGIVAKPNISQEDAISIALRECERRGWPWSEPVHIEEWLTAWHFRTNANMLGGNVMIAIDCRTGVVRKAGFARR